jgi:hypothetical protein
LTQPGLIQRIIEAAGMEDSRPTHTPASLVPLGSDPDGPPMAETWSYRSVVGMLLYLSTNTRADISYAVSQVGRFGANPRQSHATAVKTIIRYLKGTADKGLIFMPTGDMNLDGYCDADFAGLWRSEPETSPNSARSRGGYVIMLGGCLLVWKSKLLSAICLSTMESEYQTLSLMTVELLPLRSLAEEMSSHMRLRLSATARTYSTIFEDNQAALSLATNQRITSRTRYLLTKFHHFWSSVGKTLMVVRVESSQNVADIFTKGLPREVFERLRKKLMGW